MVQCILVLANRFAAGCWDIVFVLGYELVDLCFSGMASTDLWCWKVE